MKKLILIVLCFSPVVAFATGQSTPVSTSGTIAGLSGFFSYFGGWASDVWELFTVEFPDFLVRALAYLVEWLTYVKLQAMLHTMQLGWEIAKVILEDLALGSQLNTLTASLPGDIQAFLSLFRVLDGIEMLITAHLTRYVMDFI